MHEWLEYVDDNRYMIRLDQLLKLLLRYLWIILLSTLLLGGAAYTYADRRITPLYQSSIKLYVNNSINTSDSTSITSADITASQNLVDTYAVVLTSYPTLSAVIEQTGVSYSYETLEAMITTAAINDTEVFKVTVTSADPEEAAVIANAIAEIVPDEIMDIISGSSVKVVEYARVASSQSSPDTKRYAFMGAAAGMMFSCAGILLVSLLKNGMSVEDKIRRDFKNKAILAVIPLMGKKVIKKKGRKASSSGAELCGNLSFAAAEAYRLLRENISFCLLDEARERPYTIIGVTSSVRVEGKTTTAVNLAYTAALAGKKVCLIDCDFRLPSIAERLKLQEKPGMTNFLIGKSDASGVLQAYTSGEAVFSVISAGDIAQNSSELLGSRRMQKVLETVGRSFDYLILDLPPIGVVSDALTVTKYIDGMLFAVREDFYEKRLLRESMRTLETANTKLLGMVVTCSKSYKRKYKHYGEKYEYRKSTGKAIV